MKLLKKIALSLAVFFLIAAPARSRGEDKNIVVRANTVRKAIKSADFNNHKTYETNAGQFNASWVNWGNWGNWNNWNNWRNWNNWGNWGNWGNF
jgi:hypothetical protein